jgi:hypothetical protein
MGFRTIDALNQICLLAGGAGGHRRTVRALNEWALRLGGAAGHSRTVAALNEISRRLGGLGGHARTVAALKEISLRLGGAGGHKRSAAALGAILARLGAEGLPAPAVPVYVFGDSNSDPIYSPGSWVGRTLAALDGRFFMPPGANMAAAGASAALAERQLPLLGALTAAWGPGVVWYHHGYNYSASAPSEAAAVFAAAKAMGHQVVWIVPGPWTSAAGQFVPALVDAYAGDPKVQVIRGDLMLAQATHTADNNHLNEAGDLVLRDALLGATAAVFGTDGGSLYDRHGLAPIPMTGAAGTVVGPATGQVPAGWVGSRNAGDGAVAFACVDEGGRPAVEVSIGGGSLATTAFLQLPSPGLALAWQAGDFIDGAFSGRLVSGSYERFGLHNFPSRPSAGSERSTSTAAGVWRSAGYNLPRAAAGAAVPVVVEVRCPAGESLVLRVWDVAAWKRQVPQFAPVLDRGGVPEIGAAVAGEPATVGGGSWFGRPNEVSLGYQWQVDGADVAGATAASWAPSAAYAGRSLRCVVTATNAAGSTRWTTFPRTVANAAAAAPAISGTAAIAGGGVVGTAQTVTGFTVGGVPAPTLALSWRRNGVEVGTGPSYLPSAADLGAALTCVLTATNAGGTATAETAAVTVVAAEPSRQPETEAFAARLAALGGAAMDGGQIQAFDAFYVAAKGSSWWSKVAALHVPGLHDPQAANIDLVDPARTATHAGSAAPASWSAALGWTAKNNAGVVFGVDPGAVVSRDSAAVFLWYTDATPATNESIFDLTSNDGTLQLRQQGANGLLSARVNCASSQNLLAVGTAPGFRCASRTAGSLTTLYGPAGTGVGTSGTASQPVGATEVGLWSTGPNPRRSVAVAGLARGLDAAEMLGLRDALAALASAFWLG